MKNLLITGGAGFIGTNFVYYWLNKYPEDHIIVLDALTYAGNKENLSEAQKKSGFEFIHGNILNKALVESLIVKNKIDTIVHFAAESHVDRSIHGPDEFINTNIVGTHVLLKAAKKIWLDRNQQNHRFHHISTDEVYGSLKPMIHHLQKQRPMLPTHHMLQAKQHLIILFGLTIRLMGCG